MTNHPPLALIRLTHQKAPTMGSGADVGHGNEPGTCFARGWGTTPRVCLFFWIRAGDRFPFNRIILSPEIQADLLTFTAEDIANLPGIIERWRRQSDPVSA